MRTTYRNCFLWISLGLATMLSAGMNLSKAAETNTPAEALLKRAQPLVIGHRGYSAIAPENTLPSFKLAIKAGADLVELDYYHSKDGVPVVIHDGTLDRTTDAVAQWGAEKVKVESKTAAELQQLDAGKWFDSKYAGTRLPLLTEALDTISQSNGVTLIERKGGEAATLVALLRERGLVNRVIVQSFDWKYLQDYHQQEPTQVLGALGPPSTPGGKKLTAEQKALSPAWIDEAVKTGARAVVWDKGVSRSAVEYAHQHGLKVWVYTIDSPALATELLDQGVDGIITNNPSLIWRAMALRR